MYNMGPTSRKPALLSHNEAIRESTNSRRRKFLALEKARAASRAINRILERGENKLVSLGIRKKSGKPIKITRGFPTEEFKEQDKTNDERTRAALEFGLERAKDRNRKSYLKIIKYLKQGNNIEFTTIDDKKMHGSFLGYELASDNVVIYTANGEVKIPISRIKKRQILPMPRLSKIKQ